jgi:hypothetical protein
MRMTQAIDRDAAAQVQVTSAIHVEDIAAHPVAQSQVEPAIAGHDVLRKQFTDRLELVAHDRRRG